MNPQLQQAGNTCQHFLVVWVFFSPQWKREMLLKRRALTNTGFTGHQHRPASHPTNPQAALLAIPCNRSPGAPSCLEEPKGSTNSPKVLGGEKRINCGSSDPTPFFVLFQLPIKAESKKGMSTDKAKHIQVQLRAFWGPSTFYQATVKNFHILFTRCTQWMK